jgi:hypoxanthine phosphoribosyltransferase
MKRGLQEIVAQIDKSGEQFDYIVGISRGGLVPAVHLSHLLEKPLLVLDYSLRDKQVVNYEYRRIIRDICNDIMSFHGGEPKKILMVDDIVDSGETFNTIKNMMAGITLRKIIKEQIKTCSLFYNPHNRFKEKVDYYHMVHDEKYWISFDWET